MLRYGGSVLRCCFIPVHTGTVRSEPASAVFRSGGPGSSPRAWIPTPASVAHVCLACGCVATRMTAAPVFPRVTVLVKRRLAKELVNETPFRPHPRCWGATEGSGAQAEDFGGLAAAPPARSRNAQGSPPPVSTSALHPGQPRRLLGAARQEAIPDPSRNFAPPPCRPAVLESPASLGSPCFPHCILMLTFHMLLETTQRLASFCHSRLRWEPRERRFNKGRLFIAKFHGTH